METSAVTLKNIENLFVSIADQANDYQQHIAEQRETINDLQDQFADIHDIQSQLLLPKNRYTAAAQRNSNLRMTSMRQSNFQQSNFYGMGRNSQKSVYLGEDRNDLEDYQSTDHSERPSYYQPRRTCLEIEDNDYDDNHKIRLTAIREEQEEGGCAC